MCVLTSSKSFVLKIVWCHKSNKTTVFLLDSTIKKSIKRSAEGSGYRCNSQKMFQNYIPSNYKSPKLSDSYVSVGVSWTSLKEGKESVALMSAHDFISEEKEINEKQSLQNAFFGPLQSISYPFPQILAINDEFIKSKFWL